MTEPLSIDKLNHLLQEWGASTQQSLYQELLSDSLWRSFTRQPISLFTEGLESPDYFRTEMGITYGPYSPGGYVVIRSTDYTTTYYPTEPKKENGMNYSTAVFLINDQVRCVEGIYESDTRPNVHGVVNPNPGRTRFKTLDPSIKVGDFVLVPTDTRHGMSVNKIVAVDVDVDFNNQTQMKWVISKVDSSAYEQTLAEENKAIEVMRSAELRSQREKLRDKVLADQKAKDAMATLAITSKVETDKP